MSAWKNLHAEFAQLARALGADDQLCLRVDSSIVHVEPRIGNKGALLGARFRIEAAQPIAPYTILLRHEGALDRAGKQMGINREVQLGDAAFDQDVYIETDGQDDDVKRVLADAGVRDAVREIVTARIESLTIGGGAFAESPLLPGANGVRIDIPTKAFGDVDSVRRIIVTLARLARELARTDHGGPYRGHLATPAIKPPAKARMLRGFALVFVCIAVNLVGWWGVGFGSTPPTFGWAAFKLGALAGVLAWLLLVFASGVLLRGRSTSFRSVIAFALCASPTIMAGGRVAEWVNGKADSGAPHAEKASVRLRPQNKGGPKYEVTLLPTNEKADVDGPHRRAVAFTSTPLAVTATIGDGALGSPYLISLHSAP